jgi:cytochrome c
MLWVDADSVARTNNKERWFSSDMRDKITPIQAIAWSFQTRVPKGAIEKIVRQGDCIVIKKKGNVENEAIRHLTEEEYRELLVAES